MYLAVVILAWIGLFYAFMGLAWGGSWDFKLLMWLAGWACLSGIPCLVTHNAQWMLVVAFIGAPYALWLVTRPNRTSMIAEELNR